MSKMANGGNVGGDNPNADVNFFTQQKMTPQQWVDYAKKQGWELFESKLSAPMEEQIKRGKYFEYVNPKEYTRMPDGRLVKISDVGKTTVDYKGDSTYKPIISYGYKDTDIKDKTIESKPKGSAVVLSKNPNIYFSEKNPNVTTFVKKGDFGQMDTKIYKDNKTGKEIDAYKSYSEGGKYNPVFIEEQQPTVQSKMAIGGNVGMEGNLGGDDKDKPRTRKIGQSGVDLTADIIINKDPAQISKDINYGGWNAFQSFLKKQTLDGEPFIGNPRLNTTEGKQLGQNMIDTFNNSQYVKDYPQNKITPEQVQAIQQYHKLADPNVQTEGWFGSQTSRMRYPQPTVSYMKGDDNTIASKEGYVPVFWGNKRYVAPATSPENIKTFEIYDPKKHDNLLQKPPNRGYDQYRNQLNQFLQQQNASVQPKNKGGLVGSFKRGGSLEDKLLKGLKQVGSTAYGVGEGLLDTVTMGATDALTDQGYSALQDMAGSTASEKREQDSLRGYGTAAGAVGGAVINPASAGTAMSQAGKGLGQGISKGSESERWSESAGNLLNVAGQLGNVGYVMRDPKMSDTQQSKSDKYNTSKFGKKTNQYLGYNTEEFAKGGTIKGAGTGTSDSIVTDINKRGIPEGSFITPAKNNEMAKGIRGMVLGQNPDKVAEFKKGGTTNSDKVAVSNGEHLFTPAEKEKIIKYLGKEILEKLAPEAEENEMEKKKGGMIKRADGSYSKRGLWDNIRANTGSGKKPTAEMLKQERKIVAEKAKGGYVVKRSSERKGKTHVVTGPDGTKKYFGDSNLGQHPNDPARKKAFYARHEKNLKKNPYFRAFARETWAEGGTVGSKMNKEVLGKELIKKANGGNVAVADKTKVKSPNVYEGKMPEKKEQPLKWETFAFYHLPEKGPEREMFEKIKKESATKKAKGGELTKSKAKEILHDKSVHGKPLTDKQRKYMGYVAGGKKNMGGIVGKYAMGGNVNRDWDWG